MQETIERELYEIIHRKELGTDEISRGCITRFRSSEIMRIADDESPYHLRIRIRCSGRSRRKGRRLYTLGYFVVNI